MDFKKIAFVFLINLSIALGFFFDNINADVTDISSDLCNIIPICKKLDNPSLFQNDMYLNDINDVKYYTPFYVESLRAFAVLTSGDYIQALNLLNFTMHLLYGLLWFFFFYTLRKDFWLALIFSIFFRGILWPPGGELLGISDLWTAMPRTLFITLAPIPLLTFVYLKKYKVAVSAFMLGLILNFHPISGVGMIVCYFSVYFIYSYYQQGFNKQSLFNFAVAIFACFCGMLPYLLTYLLNVKSEVSVDPDIFALAFERRLGDTFSNPMHFIAMWNRPILIILLATFIIFYFFDQSIYKRNFKMLLFAIIVTFVTANASVYIEEAVNHIFDKNLRMSFQLIRYQKFILVLMQIALFLLIIEIARKVAMTEFYKKLLGLAFAITLVFSTMPIFANVPLVGDDLMTSILPPSFQVYNREKAQNMKDLGKMISFVKQNTDPKAVFYGSHMIRTGADRSVVLDIKGAGMLIEGNREKFVQWYLTDQKLSGLNTNEMVIFLKSLGVNYLLTDKSSDELIPINAVGKFYLYKIQ